LIREIMVNVSIIAPVYAIYISEKKYFNKRYSLPEIFFDPINNEYSEYYKTIEKIIDEIFNYHKIPSLLLNKTVPDVAVGNSFINESTIFNCLFTDHIW
jgi:hypothetical protein